MQLGRVARLVLASSSFYRFISLGTFYNLKNSQLDHHSASYLGTEFLITIAGISWRLTSYKLC